MKYYARFRSLCYLPVVFALAGNAGCSIACPVSLVPESTDWKTERFVSVLGGFFQCNPADPVNDLSPCNRFVARAVSKIYGINDFADPVTEYVSANNMIKIMEKPGSGWQKMKGLSVQANASCAQALANKGYAVIAGLQQQNHGHVALIIAGQLSA